MNNKGKIDNMWPIVVLIVAALVLFYPNISGLFKPAAPAEPATPLEPGYICPVDTTTLGFSAVNVDAPGTQVALLARLWVEGKPQGEVNTSATTTVSPGDKLQVWFGSSDTTQYGSLFNGEAVVPCKGTYDISGKLWTEDESVSITIYDEENDLAQTGAANNQSLGIGEQVEMRMRVKGNYQAYFGHPEVSLDNVLVIEYDKSEIDSVKVIGPNGELAKSAVPLMEDSASGNSEIGFVFPKISGSSSVDYTLVIKADDVENPSSDITVKLYDADYFYNTDTGMIEEGWETQALADIGAANEPTAIVYLD